MGVWADPFPLGASHEAGGVSDERPVSPPGVKDCIELHSDMYYSRRVTTIKELLGEGAAMAVPEYPGLM